jgi:zinc/manganese transport system substrate-binding protein
MVHRAIRRVGSRSLSTAASLAACAIALAGCGSSAPAPSSTAASASSSATEAAPVEVVASTDVYGSIVKVIGGERVAVTSIIHSPDADPHEYESTPADAAAVGRAKLVVLNGGGYDDFATKLVDAASTTPAVVNVVDLSGLRSGAPATPAGSGDAPEFNEHVWYSLPTVKKLADQLATDLGAADPADAAIFTRNAAGFTAQVDGLVAKVAAIKAAHAGDKVAVTEPVPLYLVQDAGLVNATPVKFSETAEEGTDPPAAVLQATLALFTGKQVKALLPNAQTQSPSTHQVEEAAASAGIAQVPVTETLPAGVGDYITWQRSQIDALAAALDKAAA